MTTEEYITRALMIPDYAERLHFLGDNACDNDKHEIFTNALIQAWENNILVINPIINDYGKDNNYELI